MSRQLFIIAAFLFSLPAQAAVLYSRFAAPSGDYVIEYPANWKRSIGLQAVYIRPLDKENRDALISFERYPLGKGSPRTPSDFERDLKKDIGIAKWIDTEGFADVGGLTARRVTMTVDPVADSARGDRRPAAYREVFLILPMRGEFYYVLKLSSSAEHFGELMPEFEKIVAKLQIPAAALRADHR